ncbi:MAG: mannonate dehydratase, partial [Treponema sp.]|nr:mannonate dehydratase [Treponema sp.]
MKMTMRWFGPGFDPATLDKIRQVPGISGVITTLYGVPPGEEWKKEDILALKKQVEDAGLAILGIESVNIHDAIKTGSAERDKYIEKYINTLKALA